MKKNNKTVPNGSKLQSEGPLKSTRVQIKSRKASSGAILNLHKTYLFLKCDLEKMKLENWKRDRGVKEYRSHTLRYATAERWKLESFSIADA